MQSTDIFSLGLSAAAGLATMIGAVIAVIRRRPRQAELTFAMGFSGGVMTAVSLLDLLPQAMNTVLMAMPGGAGALACGCACAAGMLTARLLDVMLPEQGGQGLFRLGIFSALAIMLHNLPEGMAVFLSAGENPKLGIRLCAAIGLHNIPEGISVAMPVCAATGKRGKAIGLSLLSGLSEPLGAVLALMFLRPYMTAGTLALIFCGIAGLMSAIAFYELLPYALCGKHSAIGAAGALSGILIMLANCCILG